MTVSTAISVQPLAVPPNSSVNFGAEIHNVNAESLSDTDFDVIQDTLYRKNIVVLKNQADVSPKAQYELTKRFDPTVDTYGHGQTLGAKGSVLKAYGKTIPHQPQVQVIGNGFVKSFHGLENFKLVHTHHRTFHKHPLPPEKDLGFTRFYRWHIDAALYDLNPPRVTSLMAVKVPKGRRQILLYDDGTDEEMDVPLAATAFISGYNMYDMLSKEDKEYVRTSKVEYAPHPYIWMSGARSLPHGLGMFSDGTEVADEDLPPIEQEKIQVLQMCWKNPITGRLAVQIHPSAARKIHLKDGTVIDDLKEVREIIHRIQRPAISPQYVYPHDWEEGDMVLFNNQGVMHSATGALAENEVRLFRQCNLASSVPPLGPDDVVAAK